MEAHGGGLTASSEGLHRGTTFRLVLNAAPAPGVAPGRSDERAPARPAAPVGEGRRVLLVEDNRDTLRFLAMVLGQRRFEVHAVGSVEAARAAASDGERFDLLISDIELPDGTGLELMRELGQGHVRAGIAMSGFGSEEDERMSRQAGFREHLTKPVDIGRLDAAIEPPSPRRARPRAAGPAAEGSNAV